MVKKVCVYCASSSKIDSVYFENARELGKIFAENDIELIYGGGSVGVMGALANSVMENGGKVTGIIPKFMCELEWQHNGISRLILTESMHERKEKMAKSADAIVALPGGCGTLEELLEAVTWKQLGIINKPVVILNINGYYDFLIRQLDQAVDENFMLLKHKEMWVVVKKPEEVLDAIRNSSHWDDNAQFFAKI